MAKTSGNFTLPHLISWLVRISAAAILLQLVLLLIMNVGLSPALYDLYLAAEESGWGSENVFQGLNIANSILLMLWCGFANHALREIVNPELKHGPVMSALWFIVPIAALFKPYDVVKELYQASRSPIDWDNGKARIIAWWWIIRIAGNLISTALYFFTKDSGFQADGILITLQVLLAAEAALQLFLITRMTRWQGQPVKKSVAEVF